MAVERKLTVEQMLVLLIVIQVSAVLLDVVNAKHAGVNLLRPQAVVLQLAVDLSLLLTVGVLNPDALDVSTLDDMIPLAVMLAGMWLGLCEEGRRCRSSRGTSWRPHPRRRGPRR